MGLAVGVPPRRAFYVDPRHRPSAAVTILHESAIQARRPQRRCLKTGIAKKATCHTFRHSFCPLTCWTTAHDIRTVQELLGHPGCEHHDDLHPRPEPRSRSRAQPGGPGCSRHDTTGAYAAAPSQDSKARAPVTSLRPLLRDFPETIRRFRSFTHGPALHCAPTQCSPLLRGSG